MVLQAVRAKVAPEARPAYLTAWAEWSGILFGMGIRTQLLERRDRPGLFLELTWFEREGDEAALGDDRLTRIAGDLDAAADEREGSLELYRPPPGAARSPGASPPAQSSNGGTSPQEPADES